MTHISLPNSQTPIFVKAQEFLARSCTFQWMTKHENSQRDFRGTSRAPGALGAKRRMILMRSSPDLHKRTPMLDHGRSSQIGRSQAQAPPAAARSSAG